MNELTGDTNAAAVAAGLLPRDHGLSVGEVESLLRHRLHRSSWWQPGDLPPDAAGQLGDPLPVWTQRPADPARIVVLSTALGEAHPEPVGPDEFLRVRVERRDDARELWALDRFGSVTVVPSFASRGALTRPLEWRWPLRVGVAEPAAAAGWLDDVRASYHHGVVYTADVLVEGRGHEIAIVHARDLTGDPTLSRALGSAACVIAVGDGDALDLMDAVEDSVQPVIAVGIAAPPATWWMALLEEMTHDRPIDVAVARLRQLVGVDAAIAGPEVGLDVTAPGRWLAAVALDDDESVPLADLRHWDWSSEGGGATNVCQVVDASRRRGHDPHVVVPPGAGRPLGAPAGRTDDRDVVGAEPEDGATTGDTTANDAGHDPSGAPRPGRFVHAVVDDAGGQRLTLAAGRVNRLRCWIGPDRDEVAASSDAPVTELGRDVTLQVDLLIGRDVVASGTMLLPGGTTTRSSDCELAVPPMPPGVFAGELAFTVGGRMFELVAVTGIVVADGADDRAVPPLRVESLLSHREVIDFGGRSTSSTTLDVTTHDGEIVIREFGPRSTGVYDLTGKAALVRDLMRRLYAAEKSLVRRDQHGFRGGVPDPEWTEVLRSMATHGWLLHRSLVDQGFADPGERFEVVNRLPDSYVPLEFVYDRGAPASGADIDQACLEALASNADDCGRCHSFGELTEDERDANPRLCPYGFWSLAKIIERHDAPAGGAFAEATSTDAAHRLHHLDSVLAGWSSNLRPEDRERLPDALGRDGRNVLVAGDWDAWRSRLADGPTILLALPHHDDTDGIGTLEIGGDNSLGLQRELELFVRTPAGEPGPVLILLGCETDEGGDLGHPSFARAFAAHASVVIGTLSKVLGRHAVPFAERLVESLVAAQGSGGDVGRVLRDVRRSMFADGYLMALGVIALGDADWRLAEAAA